MNTWELQKSLELRQESETTSSIRSQNYKTGYDGTYNKCSQDCRKNIEHRNRADVERFSDKDQIASYAVEGVATLVKEVL